jgi:hypothetical protein
MALGIAFVEGERKIEGSGYLPGFKENRQFRGRDDP